MKKRTKKDIFIKLIKYILLFLLIFKIIAIFLYRSSVYALVVLNLFIYLYMLFYILYFKNELKESRTSVINKVLLVIFLVIMLFCVIFNTNIIGLIDVLTIFSFYFLGVDLLRIIIKKTKITVLFKYIYEFILLIENNIFVKRGNITNKRNILILVSKLSNGRC